MRDPIVRCVSDNFDKTRMLLNDGAHVRGAIIAELDKKVPVWPKVRTLMVKLRQNDILFRQESHRVELMCLDKSSFDDRISYLKNEFRNVEPPPIILQK